MHFISTTEKIPRGYGYILKPSSVMQALRAADLQIEVNLTRHHSRELFYAWFWIPNANVPHERLYITAGTTPTLALPEIRTRVESESIPKLVSWISYILALDPRSPTRREAQYIQLLPIRE